MEEVSFSIDGHGKTVKETVKLIPGINKVEQSIPVAGLEHWNEFNPMLYSAIITAAGQHAVGKFGLRTVGNRNGMTINGIHVFYAAPLNLFPVRTIRLRRIGITKM